jgi:hypothetical protein
MLTSTAGSDRSVLLRDLFDRGVRIIDGAEPPGGFGMTWYAAPDDVSLQDPRGWRAANPALAEGRIPLAAIAEGIRNATTPEMARAERLNLWTEGTDEWLPAGAWALTIAPQPEPAGPVVLGVEVVPSWRRATVVVGYRTTDGAWVGPAGELDATRLGRSSVSPAEVVALLQECADRYRPAAVAYSAASALAQHVAAWARDADVPTYPMGPREVRAASQLFRSELVGRRLAHLDDPLTTTQVRRARPSAPLEGGEWYLSTRASLGEIDAVRASAWAAWGAIAPPEVELGSQVYV